MIRAALLPLVAMCIASVSATALAWPSVPLPEGSKGEMVTEKMNYNGIEMRASKFSTRQSMDAVEAFYKEAWGEKKVNVTPMGPQKIIGYLTGGYSVTVQLAPGGGGGTIGTIGIMRDPGKGDPPQLGRDFYRPAGTEVLSDIVHEDTSTGARTIILRNRLSPYTNMMLYNTRLQGDGWRGVAVGKCQPALPECVVNYERRDGGRMAMTLSRDEKQNTTLVVNIE